MDQRHRPVVQVLDDGPESGRNPANGPNGIDAPDGEATALAIAIPSSSARWAASADPATTNATGTGPGAGDAGFAGWHSSTAPANRSE